ncbi:MAG: hypothetical protein Q9220_006984 [cf. Caloplaca sp. 1 TL-2023]
MATDYSKKKNAELEELLKSRSLPHTGKKADLIARLQQSDKDAANPSAASKVPAEDEIDWDDDPTILPETSAPAAAASDSVPAASATTTPAAAAIAAGGKGQSANPTAVPNQIPTAEPFKSDDLTIKTPADDSAETIPTTKKVDGEGTAKEEEAPKPPPTDYTANIPTTSLESELEKRKARAARFGTTVDADDKEKEKAAERAKRFGTEASKPVVKGLDEALPERSRKRGRGGEDGGDRSRGKRGKSGGGGRSRSKGAEGKAKQVNGNAKTAQREKDNLAAEARKKRFGP